MKTNKYMGTLHHPTHAITYTPITPFSIFGIFCLHIVAMTSAHKTANCSSALVSFSMKCSWCSGITISTLQRMTEASQHSPLALYLLGNSIYNWEQIVLHLPQNYPSKYAKLAAFQWQLLTMQNLYAQ